MFDFLIFIIFADCAKVHLFLWNQFYCFKPTLNKNNTNALGWLINSSYQQIGILNDTTTEINMWTWTDFNCSYDEIRTFYPYWDFKARDIDAVETEDFLE